MYIFLKGDRVALNRTESKKQGNPRVGLQAHAYTKNVFCLYMIMPISEICLPFLPLYSVVTVRTGIGEKSSLIGIETKKKKNIISCIQI